MGWRDDTGDEPLGGGLSARQTPQSDGLVGGHYELEERHQVQSRHRTHAARQDQYQYRNVTRAKQIAPSRENEHVL